MRNCSSERQILGGQQFVDRAVRLIDGDVGVRGCARIRVGNGDAAEWLATKNVWLLSVGPFWIEQRIVFVAVAVRPAIDGDGCDVARRIESAGGNRSRELIANFAFKQFKGSDQQFHSPGFVLLASWQPGLAWSTTKMNENRFLWRTRAPVVADIDSPIEANGVPVGAGSIDT